ncbi:MAG: hypothetical protein J7L25_14965 [Deltaproteobacteria bacterium]|nr:hypothetical protein [Candidatus Tharpella aukensis]
MEAIREIQTVKDGQIQLHLPKQFWKQQVEIIILTVPQKKIINSKKISLRGCLHHYANPSVNFREEDAWHNVVKEKYGNH